MRTSSDREIRRTVLDELQSDPKVEEMYLGVDVRDGVVTLSGRVSSYAKRLAAQEATRRVPGVRSVIDRIDVGLPGD